ncbi:MAG: hypothetical protein IJD81_00585 [Oscillospiraceae bacterium]|nr:hypothetical protein [Oscillospiraceae bacterium]
MPPLFSASSQFDGVKPARVLRFGQLRRYVKELSLSWHGGEILHSQVVPLPKGVRPIFVAARAGY